LEEIIDLGTDDTNRQSLVLGGNFQAKHAQQKQEVAHFRKDYYQDRVNCRGVGTRVLLTQHGTQEVWMKS
jgi:hypothetical protein